MFNMHSSPHSVPYDIQKPDTGLAEWTSKIKAMQRQVDADEEAEQQRLEEEIAASRLARLRRSHATGDSSKRLDLSKASPSPLQDNDVTSPDNTIPIVERYTGQPSAHRTPSARNAHREGIVPTRIQSSDNAQPPPISLAAFIGGRATGPRLNRHAPQQDTHDPTQFHQRKDDFAPHPVFGKGGVAMPGMAGRGITITETSGQVIDNPSNDIAPVSSVSRKESPLTAKPEQARPITRAPNLRERTTSTSALPSSSSSPQVKHDLVLSRSTADLKQDRATGFHGLSTPGVAKLVEQPITPHRERGNISKPSPESSIMTPSLARPVYPQPRLSTGPQMPVSSTPSPAFLRPPPPKDLTPSISRLQGRGFVQSMVNVSRQLESSSTSDGDSEHSRKPDGRRISVLDRWQPNLPASSSPPVSPTPKSMRRSVTVDPVSATPDRQRAPIAGSPKKLKPVKSSSSLQQANAEAVPPIHPSSDISAEDNKSHKGLGSATTLLVYKPMSLSPPTMDEFGLKSDTLSNSGIYKTGKLPASSGKPLSHPTKNRARKPLTSRQPERTIYPQRPTSTSESPTPTHPNPTPVVLSDNPVLSSKPLTTEKNTSTIGSPLADMATVGPKLASSANVPEHPSRNMFQRALPGMVGLERASTTAVLPDESLPDTCSVFNEEAKPSSVVLSGETPLVPTPSRHSRIPSTGNRATVMDVAQVLNTQFPKLEPASEPQLLSPTPAEASHLRNLTPSAVHMEKRKSSHEKYSTIILPPLKEEATPTVSPAGTLSHATSNVHQQKLVHEVLVKVKGLDDDDAVFPSSDIELLIKPPLLFSADVKSETISVDTILVTGTTATVVSQHQAIFYDTELLAIVYRSKSRTTGLASTTVWAWRGKRCILGEKENKKLQELGQRYGTAVNIVQQYSEPPQLVYVLGGQLATRQGVRARWTSENTTMHLVRSKGGMIFVDEHDLSIQSLCSGFSYCLSILGTVYAWYGRGSTLRERQAALEYARGLEVGGTPVIELYENERNDEMFWMILGEEEYANADYWKWRKNSSIIDARIWRVNAHTNKDALLPVDTFSGENSFHSSVYILDCVWELYVMVGSDARGHRQDIRLGVKVALELSLRVAPERPYAPTVHVLMLPSQLPRDLRLNFRDLDELYINHNNIPNHMNILSSKDALDHLQKFSWDKVALQDQTMLPLGIGP